MTGFTYRYANLNDADPLLDFARRTFIAAFAADNTAADMQSYLDASMTQHTQRQELQDADTKIRLMEQQSTLVGYASVRRRPVPECVDADTAVELHRFYVDPQLKGSGAASMLMQQVFASAHELSGQHLWLGVWEHNPRAIRFYEKQGFTDVGSIDFTLGSSPQTDRVLLRELPPAVSLTL